MKAKAVSKGVTPVVTTAATSRQTQSPTRKPTKRDDSLEPRKADKSLASTHRKASAAKVAPQSTPQVPKGLQSANKGNFISSGSKLAKKYKLEILGITELLDINMKKFEKDNNLKLNSILNSLLHAKLDSDKKRSVEKSAEKSSRSLSKLKPKKKKVSDLHLNVGLGKRVDPYFEDEKREARVKWEKINIKKDHLKKFTEKDKQYRVL